MNCTLITKRYVQQYMADPRNRCGGCHVKIGLGEPLSLPKIGPTPRVPGGVIADFVSPQIVSPRTESATVLLTKRGENENVLFFLAITL